MAPGLVAAKPTLTRKALAARIGVTADVIKYHLTELTENGRIRRVGPTPVSYTHLTLPTIYSV